MTTHPEKLKAARWAELQRALQYVRNAEFEIGRGDIEAGLVWVGDIRRALGVLALLCGDDPDSEGYARLLEHVLTEPHLPGGHS